jgi:acetoacetyl-CoA synthetase
LSASELEGEALANGAEIPLTLAVSRDAGCTLIATIIEKLVPIWESVLQQSAVSENDNFFSLGGNPSLAVRLFDEISKLCHRELPPLVIYHAPTIAKLAAVLQPPCLPQFLPLVPLKPGNEETPLFLAHGLGGSVMEFFELVKNIETNHAIFGLQAIAETGADVEFERIEDMAEFYADAIQRQQPHGPYLLMGYSLGGLMAFEIAQRLSKLGKKIRLLILLDAYPHESFLGFGLRARQVARLSKYHASIVKRLPMRTSLRYLLSSSERVLHAARGEAESFIRRPYIGHMQAARDKAYQALTRYQPRRYSGKIKFVRAAVASVFPSDPAAVWTPWVKHFEVETAPGDHYGMISPYADRLGLLISRYLREAE